MYIFLVVVFNVVLIREKIAKSKQITPSYEKSLLIYFK